MESNALTFVANLLGAALLLKAVAYRVHTIILRRTESAHKPACAAFKAIA